jgi:hypothetical protein
VTVGERPRAGGVEFVLGREVPVCVADTLKNAVRLTFPKGADLNDLKRLFNTRLESKTV